MTRWTDESSDACKRCPVTGHLSQASEDTPDVTSGGRLFQTWGPATGKALSPTVDMQVRLWLDGGPYVSTATLNYNGCAAECAANVGWSARRTRGLSVVSRRSAAKPYYGALQIDVLLLLFFLFFYYYYYVAHSKKSRWNILDFKMFPWILLRDPPIREVRCIVSFDKTAIQNHVTQTVNSPEYYIARLCRGQRDIHWNVVVKTSMWE